MIGRFKCDGLTEMLMVYEFDSSENLLTFIEENINFYIR